MDVIFSIRTGLRVSLRPLQVTNKISGKSLIAVIVQKIFQTILANGLKSEFQFSK